MRTLRRQIRAVETHCWQCGQRIDWSIPYWVAEPGGQINPDAGTVEHKLSLSRHPHLAEDLGNLAASHARCNQAAGNNEDRPTLGVRSREW